MWVLLVCLVFLDVSFLHTGPLGCLEDGYCSKTSNIATLLARLDMVSSSPLSAAHSIQVIPSLPLRTDTIHSERHPLKTHPLQLGRLHQLPLQLLPQSGRCGLIPKVLLRPIRPALRVGAEHVRAEVRDAEGRHGAINLLAGDGERGAVAEGELVVEDGGGAGGEGALGVGLRGGEVVALW